MSMGDGVPGNMESVMGVIPARYNSTRFPGKPLVDIFGKPMIYWVAKRVEASCLEAYCVATDDLRIFSTCEGYGIPCVMTSEECTNGTERVAEVAQQKPYDFFINIQGDEPCIDIDSINEMVLNLQKCENVNFLQAVSLMDDQDSIADPTVVKVAITSQNHVIYYSRAPIPYPRNGERSEYYKCLGLYLYSKEFLEKYSSLEPTKLEEIELIEQLRVLENNLQIKAVLVSDDSCSIDTPEDLEYLLQTKKCYFT